MVAALCLPFPSDSTFRILEPCPEPPHTLGTAADFYEEHYGIGGHQESALRILDLALGAHPSDCKVSERASKQAAHRRTVCR